jgi:hypothetical protein
VNSSEKFEGNAMSTRDDDPWAVPDTLDPPKLVIPKPSGPPPTAEQQRAWFYEDLIRTIEGAEKNILALYSYACEPHNQGRGFAEEFMAEIKGNVTEKPFDNWHDVACWCADLLESSLTKRNTPPPSDINQFRHECVVELVKYLFPDYGVHYGGAQVEIARLRVWPHPISARGEA